MFNRLLLLQDYPIGHIYLSTVEVDLNAKLGGTWERIQDVFLLASGSKYTAGSTGGEANHVLTVGEMPSHTHKVYGYYSMNPQGGNYVAGGVVSSRPQHYGNYPESTGGSQAHNNMPPYLAVYAYRRVA